MYIYGAGMPYLPYFMPAGMEGRIWANENALGAELKPIVTDGGWLMLPAAIALACNTIMCLLYDDDAPPLDLPHSLLSRRLLAFRRFHMSLPRVA